MTQTTASAKALRQIRPKPITLEHILRFWALAVLLPAAAVFCLLNYSEQQNREAAKASVTDNLLETFDNLQRACNPLNYFTDQIARCENHAGLPERNAPLFATRDGVSEVAGRLQRLFSRQMNHDLLLLITCESDLQSTRIFMDPVRVPDYPRPGLRAARELMKEYRNVATGSPKPMSVASRRIFRSIATAVFGSYFDPLNADDDFSIGFSDMAGGNRIFSARRLVKSADGKTIFSYLAIFREAENMLAHSFSLATRQLADSDFTFRLKMLPANPFPFIHEDIDGTLKLYGPVDFALLTTGSFKNRDILKSLHQRGIMTYRPAIYPHFEITAPHQTFVNQEYPVRPGFVIFLFLCLTLLLTRNFHQQGNMHVNIRTRLFLSVLLATILPTTTFVFYMHRHIKRDFLRRQQQVGMQLKNHLKQLELAVRSGDQAHYSGFQAFINKMREVACSSSKSELQHMLQTGLDKTFSGIGLLRNDGMLIESLDYEKIYVIKLEKKLQITREFVYASIIRFFQYMRLLQDSFLKNLQADSRGKKLLAMAEIFPPIDVDNFCSYEGTSQTSKQDFGNFRMMNYKMLPQQSATGRHGAVLLLIQDIRELAHLIIDEMARQPAFFRQKTEEGLIETTVISCFDLRCTTPDMNKIWPATRPAGQRTIEMAHRLALGKAERETFSVEADGTPIVTAARKMAGYPLIAIAECRMSKLGSYESLTLAIITGILFYILMLLSILVSILTGLFTPPIETLLSAAKLTGAGTPVQIKNSFKNELSHLTSEFNNMNEQIREREQLERFISREAAEIIVSESREHIDIAPQKVKRSIVFIHICDFSRLNTILTPEELFRLLNQYFSCAEECLKGTGGQIDKYIGDAIMAVFAEPAAGGNTAASCACMAAGNIISSLGTLNRALIENQLPGIRLGIGISSGEVISGRIGSYQSRLDYTVIGDRVNLAARLEAASHFGSESHILIDEETMKQAGHSFASRFYGEIAIKGKSLPVKTYEIII
ncbi:MAG TPA: adenylate/guanylate cyclase domain-containing protein [Candidatus Rifleibacterium sp.]|mgnify:CR=1 FL=1|nr:adenylate/guanylate cyclase domain-containing protein [Candidatus Rifleibacterium sp.]HPT44950.1 adenylate/guanylate cyclase domain-containing protein [Candidatus Rifleibacterium sp.]